jgi:hypothetical protein
LNGNAGIEILELIAPDEYSAGTETGAYVDLGSTPCESLLVVLHTGAFATNATLDVHLEEDADGSGAGTDISGAVFTQKLHTTDETIYYGFIDVDTLNYDYIRAIGVTATAAATYSVIAIPIGQKFQPVIASSSLEFDL